MTLDELRKSERAVITVTEAAQLLEIDERTVRRGCADGQIPHARVGARLLILRGPFVELLDGAHVTDPPRLHSA